MASVIQFPDQCSNFYELLGLKPFESDARVIDSKVRERMREARKYQVGQFAEMARKHLDLLAEASTCLLDASRKETYDEQLRRQYDLPPVSVSSTFDGSLPVSSAPLVPPQSLIPPPAVFPPTELQATLTEFARRRHQRLLGVCVVAIVLGIVCFAISQYEPAKTVAFIPGGSQETSHSAIGNPTIPAPAVTQGTATGSPPVSPSTAESNAAAASNSSDPIPTSPAVASQPVEDNEDDGEPDLPVANVGTKGQSQPALPPTSKVTVNTSNGNSTKSTPSARPTVEQSPTVAAKVVEDLNLTPTEVLRELKFLRLNRPANSKLPSDIVTPGWERAERLVRYGFSAHRDDKRFLKQLKQEIVAQKRVFPRLVDALRDVVD